MVIGPGLDAKTSTVLVDPSKRGLDYPDRGPHVKSARAGIRLMAPTRRARTLFAQSSGQSGSPTTPQMSTIRGEAPCSPTLTQRTKIPHAGGNSTGNCR